MRPTLLLPVPLFALVLTGCLPDLPEEKAAAEGEQAGDCTDDADNDADGAFDCDDEGCAGSDACAVEPGPPEGLGVAIDPAAPGDDDDLRCAVTTEAVDPNGDAVSYSFAWSVDGVDAGLSTDTVASALTDAGESWTCTVTPGDGTLTGTPASATVTIQRTNAAPSAPVVAITPETPNDNDGLACAVTTESVDPDGDAVTYAYAWTVDGVDAGVAAASVDPARTRAGETWTCSVTASDGSATSEPGTASVTVAAAPTCGDGTVTHTASGVDFVTVCAQTFEMGCTAGMEPCTSAESLVEVTLSNNTLMGATEVTQGQFRALSGYNPSRFASCGDDCPVESVSWSEAAWFANTLSLTNGLDACYRCEGSGPTVNCVGEISPYVCNGYRLPTEAEWEASARCGTDLRYSGGDVLNSVAWNSANSGASTHPVALLAANGCGIFDMSGNVWEFAHDGFDGVYRSASGDVDPVGVGAGVYRAQRGGSWFYGDVQSRVSFRWRNESGFRNDEHGFRLARTAP